jgi:hypothetical protein
MGASKSNDRPPVASKDARLAKDIFYVADAKPEAPVTASEPLKLALKYKILWQRGDETQIVADDFAFRKGDRFRIIFEGNATGHIYIFHKGASGKGIVLFPDKRINGGDNGISAHVEAVIPASGWYEFDEKAGVEELIVFYAPKPIKGFSEAIASGVVTETVWIHTMSAILSQRKQSLNKGMTRDIIYVENGAVDLSATATGPASQSGPNTTTAPTAAEEADDDDEEGSEEDGEEDTQESVVLQPSNTLPSTIAATQTTDGDGLLVHTITLHHK